MGLDMYLQRRVGKNRKSSEVMYWRKVNHIHGWFVQNVQDGVDDCGTYEVSISDLRDLYSICVLAWLSRDSNLLPTQEGFFFGGTEIDDYYWDTLVHTMEVLKPFHDKDESDFEGETFWYHASW